MNIVSGYICLTAVLFLMLKFPARKFRLGKADRFLMKFHKYAAALFLTAGILHFVLVFPVLPSRLSPVWLTGIISLIAGVLLTVLCHVMKDRNVEKIFHRALSALIIFMVLLHMVFYWYDYHSYRTKIQEIKVQEVDLSGIPDGVYTGESDVGYVYAKVRLTVKNGKIENAELLEHRNERGSKAESILENIVSGQKIDVDAVSGATNSSLVIKKACENALKGD